MNLAQAVSTTTAYAEFFGFPLFPLEIHHWLSCSHPVSLKKIYPFLPKDLSLSDLRLREQRSRYTRQKVLHAKNLVKILKYLPGLKLVALTGSVAAQNSRENDDIDLLFVTSSQALWLVRPLALSLISLFFRRRYPQEDPTHTPNAFCPNLWLDTTSLTVSVSKQSLYTAHEVLQIVPLLDREGTYLSFLKANAWTKKYLANAYASSFRAQSRNLTPSTTTVILAKAGIHQVNSKIHLLLAPFNLIFFAFQLLYMHSKKTTEIVSLHSAFLHTTDFSSQINSHLKLNNI